MTSTQSPISTTHTFMESKPPLMPRQSTSDVLSFTHIIAARLATGQNVWDYFSPPPPPPAITTPAPAESSPSPTRSPSPAIPPSPSATSAFSFFGSKRQSLVLDTTQLPQVQSLASPSGSSPTSTSVGAGDAKSPSSENTSPTTPTPTSTTTTTTPKAQKRKSFAQSLRSMLSLSQLIMPGSTKAPAAPTGPPHYNILVLGADSAPLASTLYKMSSLLPSATKISHYQEISGFFMAHFRSNGSFSCSPKSSTEEIRQSTSSNSARASGQDGEVKSRNRSGSGGSSGSGGGTAVGGLETIDDQEESEMTKDTSKSQWRQSFLRRTSDESEATTTTTATTAAAESGDNNKAEEGPFSSSLSASASSSSSSSSSSTSEADASTGATASLPLSVSANASLSVHAFSLDMTWPVPRTLAQTFWFPHAHGIIYIVDATRKNDPRGMDHLLNARQFLNSLVLDPHFKRRDIPLVVFANKAGVDDKTCFRVDEIADILGCEEWEDGVISLQVGDLGTKAGTGTTTGTGAAATAAGNTGRPWCVKSTRSDGEGEGLRESVEWLKSRMGEIWKA